MTAIHERSRAGAVILKIELIVSMKPMAIQTRIQLMQTTSQTTFKELCV